MSEEEEKEEKKKKKISKKKICGLSILIFFLLISAIFYIGIQEREAFPAKVEEGVLEREGWKFVDERDVPIDVEISFLKLRINMKMLRYTDELLAKKIEDEKRRLESTYGISLPKVPASSVLVTLRIMPPLLSELAKSKVEEIVSGRILPQYESIVKQFGVENFREIDVMDLLISGKTVSAKVYEGELDEVRIRGISAIWSDDGIVAAMGLVPYGEVGYTILGQRIPIIDFGESEFAELRKLIESIE
jgi:hypothetical protein